MARNIRKLRCSAEAVFEAEDAISGPARFVPRVLTDAVIRWRNAETLHRLAYLAEGREHVARSTAHAEEADHPSSGRHADHE